MVIRRNPSLKTSLDKWGLGELLQDLAQAASDSDEPPSGCSSLASLVENVCGFLKVPVPVIVAKQLDDPSNQPLGRLEGRDRLLAILHCLRTQSSFTPDDCLSVTKELLELLGAHGYTIVPQLPNVLRNATVQHYENTVLFIERYGPYFLINMIHRFITVNTANMLLLTNVFK